MIITVDTSKDSKHEIQKAIRLLQSLAGNEPVYTNAPGVHKTPEYTPPPGQSVFGGLFDMPPEPAKTEAVNEEQKEKAKIEVWE